MHFWSSQILTVSILFYLQNCLKFCAGFITLSRWEKGLLHLVHWGSYLGLPFAKSCSHLPPQCIPFLMWSQVLTPKLHLANVQSPSLFYFPHYFFLPHPISEHRPYMNGWETEGTPDADAHAVHAQANLVPCSAAAELTPLQLAGHVCPAPTVSCLQLGQS